MEKLIALLLTKKKKISTFINNVSLKIFQKPLRRLPWEEEY
jgi:hypothetical protein